MVRPYEQVFRDWQFDSLVQSRTHEGSGCSSAVRSRFVNSNSITTNYETFELNRLFRESTDSAGAFFSRRAGFSNRVVGMRRTWIPSTAVITSCSSLRSVQRRRQTKTRPDKILSAAGWGRKAIPVAKRLAGRAAVPALTNKTEIWSRRFPAIVSRREETGAPLESPRTGQSR